MAERRMFAKTIVLSDAFLDMPLSARCLYFTLGMLADDDGFVNSPKSIMRQAGASTDDLNLLMAKRFILAFDSGVIVIKHWRIHNYIQKDRYKESKYMEEKATLMIDQNGAYTECIQDVSTLDTQVRLGKDRDRIELGEGSKGKKETTHDLLQKLLPDYTIPMVLQVKMGEWITYKTERKEQYKEQGMKSLLRQIETNCAMYGDQAICDLIDDSMANGWKGIIFDRLKQKAPARSNRSHSGNVFLEIAQEEGIV